MPSDPKKPAEAKKTPSAEHVKFDKVTAEVIDSDKSMGNVSSVSTQSNKPLKDPKKYFKWGKVTKGRPMTPEEIDALKKEMEEEKKHPPPKKCCVM